MRPPTTARRETNSGTSLPVNRLDAIVFDMDGVVTETAMIHARSWKRVFDDFLRTRSEVAGEPFRPFELTDYLQFVDGKPRYDGAASFLASRDIFLPQGNPTDPPGYDSISSIGNLKDHEFQRQVAKDGIRPYASTLEFIRNVRARGLKTALITSSRHGRAVLKLAGITDLFDAIVDGVDADRHRLAGKPDPGIYLAAASLLSVPPGRTAVVEDALAGVEAGRNGHFALVVGVDRGAGEAELLEHGADLVVSDMSEFDFGGTGIGTSV
jgi:trehalose 6-phosphate phosphatase